jgi:hypothetical protein
MSVQLKTEKDRAYYAGVLRTIADYVEQGGTAIAIDMHPNFFEGKKVSADWDLNINFNVATKKKVAKRK